MLLLDLSVEELDEVPIRSAAKRGIRPKLAGAGDGDGGSPREGWSSGPQR
jgi:hypothetical protein